MRTILGILPLVMMSTLVLPGCSGDKDTGSAEGGEEGGEEGGDDSGGMLGWGISGTAANLIDPKGTAPTAAEGLCVHAADPSAAISGGELEIMASSTVGAGGAYAVSGIMDKPSLGALMIVADCDTSASTVLPTATGVSSASYNSLEDGGEITGYTIYSIDGTGLAALSTGLAAAGYTGDLTTDGALVGFVLDASGNPIAGAAVGAPKSSTVYYMNADGSFNTTSTVAETNAMFVIPAAPISTYTCTAEGYTFESQLIGSQPGIAVIFSFNAS